MDDDSKTVQLAKTGLELEHVKGDLDEVETDVKEALELARDNARVLRLILKILGWAGAAIGTAVLSGIVGWIGSNISWQ